MISTEDSMLHTIYYLTGIILSTEDLTGTMLSTKDSMMHTICYLQ